MKSNQGILDDKETAARTRFWNKKGFFGEPTRKQLERDSMKMQKLVKALKTLSSFGEVKEIRDKKLAPQYLVERFTRGLSNDMHTVRSASESDFNHAISTFKIF